MTGILRVRPRPALVPVAVLLCGAVSSLVATAPASAVDRSGSTSWSSIFETLRPLQPIDPHRVIVLFTDPSLAEWQAASTRQVGPAGQRRFVRQAVARQDDRLADMRRLGVEFTLEYRYVRVVNGVSIRVHGDGMQWIRSLPGVSQVSEVRTLYPATVAVEDATGHLQGHRGSTRVQAGGSAARRAAPRTATRVRVASGGAALQPGLVAVLDTGIDFNHPMLHGAQGGAGYDVLADRIGVDPSDSDDHGTQVAGAVVDAAGSVGVRLASLRILASEPVIGGYEAVVGRTDALVAGLERSVDLDGDGSAVDHASVALAAVSAPYAGFANTPEELAVAGAANLGTLTVAAAGNDGASGDSVGTVGSPAAAVGALAVGAVDLRGQAPVADVHARGGLLDTVFADLPVLTGSSTVADRELPVVAIDGVAADVVDYLGSDVRSRVAGGVALISFQEGVLVGDQLAAAADAGAVAVLVAGVDRAELAGVVEAGETGIPAIGVSEDAARAIREAAKTSRVGVRIAIRVSAGNRSFGRVAGFSSRGPRFDGIGRPDVLAAGVGVVTSALGVDDHGEARYVAATGTSIAAAEAAGQAAALRIARPDWSAARVRAALIGSAQPSGSLQDREPVEAQGAGVVNALSASNLPLVATPARLDFGVVVPGGQARRPLAFASTRDGADAMAPRLFAENLDATGPAPAIDGTDLVLQVARDARPGVYGGWLVAPDVDLRVPWLVVVRARGDLVIPLDASLSRTRFRPSVGPGSFPARLSISVGGTPEDGSLGVEAASRVEVVLRDTQGRSLGTLATLTNVLPGVYELGVSGRDAMGAPLPPGRYTIQVRSRSAAAANAPWQAEPALEFRIAR